MDLYSIQIAVEIGWTTYLEPTGDVAVLHDTLTRLRHEGCPCRLVKCKPMREYPAEKPEPQDETVMFAADRMYDAIRQLGDTKSEWLFERTLKCLRTADDYDAAISAATPELSARVRRTL